MRCHISPIPFAAECELFSTLLFFFAYIVDRLYFTGKENPEDFPGYGAQLEWEG